MLAAAAVTALVLSWPTSATVVYVIDGPTVTPTSPDSMTGFAHLGGFRYVAVLVIACTVLVTFVPAARSLLRSTPGFVAIVVLVIVAGAMAVNPVWSPAAEDVRWSSFEEVVTGDFGAAPRLVPTDDGVAVATDTEVIDTEDGKPVVLARTADRDVTVLGVVHGRLVYHRADVWEVRVVRLDEPARPAVVTGVLSADSMSAFGFLLFRTTEANAPVLRRLDVDGLAAGSTRSFTEVDALPLPSTRTLAETDDPDRPMRFVEDPRTEQVVALDNTELGMGTLMGAMPDAGDWQAVMKPPVCGSLFTGFDEVAPDQHGGWWLLDTANGALRHVRADGEELEVDLPFEDTGALAMATGYLGVPYVATTDGLWRLSSIAQRELLPAGPRCPLPAAVAGPARLDTLDRDPEAVPLDVSGRRWVMVDGDRAELVTPDGRRPLPGRPQRVVTDGSGGLWFLTSTGTWLHLNASGEELGRHPTAYLEPDPDGGYVNSDVVVDLSGGAPMVGKCHPWRVVDGGAWAEAMFGESNCWDDLVVGRDGRVWLVSGFRLFSSGPAGTAPLTTGAESVDPVATQLADGVAPNAVPLRQPTLGLDDASRPLVLTENVLLGLTETGQVTVLAQDERLWGARLVPVEGGTLVRTRDGRLHRLDYGNE